MCFNKMIRCAFNTCACVIISERPSIEGKFEVQCRTHNTTLEAYNHNIRFRDSEANQQTERKKPQFQRR